MCQEVQCIPLILIISLTPKHAIFLKNLYCHIPLTTTYYDHAILPLLGELPCYILYRFDSKTSAGYAWLFIAWSPDSAPVSISETT